MSQPFVPNDAATSTIAATASSAATAILKPSKGPFQVRLYNGGANTVFVKFGQTGLTATTAGIPIPAGGVEVMTIVGDTGTPVTHIATICAATQTTTLYVTTGAGF